MKFTSLSYKRSPAGGSPRLAKAVQILTNSIISSNPGSFCLVSAALRCCLVVQDGFIHQLSFPASRKGRKREERMRAVFHRKFLEVAMWHFCLGFIDQNFVIWPYLLKVRPRKCGVNSRQPCDPIKIMVCVTKEYGVHHHRALLYTVHLKRTIWFARTWSASCIVIDITMVRKCIVSLGMFWFTFVFT